MKIILYLETDFSNIMSGRVSYLIILVMKN